MSCSSTLFSGMEALQYQVGRRVPSVRRSGGLPPLTISSFLFVVQICVLCGSAPKYRTAEQGFVVYDLVAQTITCVASPLEQKIQSDAFRSRSKSHRNFLLCREACSEAALPSSADTQPTALLAAVHHHWPWILF